MPNPLTTDLFSLSFREFAMKEVVPLATVHATVLMFLQDRTDTAIFGAQAVNAYVDQSRMTQDVDVMAVDAESLADEISNHLHQSLNLATRVRSVASGKGYRVYQVLKPKNRHLVDIRQVDKLPACQLSDRIQVVEPASLIALKVISMSARSNTPKGLTDQADLMRLLMTYPDLKTKSGVVSDRLIEQNAEPTAIQVWYDLVSTDFQPDNDDEY
jgi:hypothetical protein